ncbi:MAG TPA: DUF5818 domain-containing protein [Candidatus Acidoferrum sp.]|nr:DUF5818 domain-containing protein [Candidatus Acidoferrum sp.]
MKHAFRSIFLLAGAACALAMQLAASSGEEKAFVGEVADSQCALNVHSLSQSHKEMMAMKPELKTEADCAHYCVKERGGRYVLQIKKSVYKLDKQELAEPLVGLKVKVTGTLDPKTETIAVRDIEPLNSKASPKP